MVKCPGGKGEGTEKITPILCQYRYMPAKKKQKKRTKKKRFSLAAEQKPQFSAWAATEYVPLLFLDPKSLLAHLYEYAERKTAPDKRGY